MTFRAPVRDIAFALETAGHPALARAHNGLGVIAAQGGAYDDATAHWKRAVALDPHDHQTLYNLGDVLIRLGRLPEAQAYWEQYLSEAPPGLDPQDRARVRAWLAARGSNPPSSHPPMFRD